MHGPPANQIARAVPGRRGIFRGSLGRISETPARDLRGRELVLQLTTVHPHDLLGRLIARLKIGPVRLVSSYLLGPAGRGA